MVLRLQFIRKWNDRQVIATPPCEPQLTYQRLGLVGVFPGLLVFLKGGIIKIASVLLPFREQGTGIMDSTRGERCWAGLPLTAINLGVS